MKRFVIILLALAYSISDISATEQYIFKQISQKEGLTSTVNCIFKEKDGDVWLGTPGGLYRFNGYTIIYNDAPVLKGRKIHRVEEDREDNLWILTDNWPVIRRKGERYFTDIRTDGAEDGQEFYSICMDEEGIWLGSQGKLFRYTYADSTLRLFLELKDRPSFIFLNMSILDNDMLMCSSHNGIIIIDTTTGMVKEGLSGSHREVSASLTDTRGNIWLAFYNNGIEVYDSNGKLTGKYNTENSMLNNNVVLCMTERDSTIWAGTDGGGINIIDADRGQVTTLSHIAGDQSSFPAHSIKSIYTDDYGNVWAGSIRNGLIQISRSEMKTYTDCHIGMESGLSNPTVLCLHQDRNSGFIWIGTDGEGLNRFDPVTHKFVHYPSTLKTKVVSIADYSDTELALSLYADRIVLFDKNTGKTRDLEINDHDLNYRIRYAGRSINMVNERDGNILFIYNSINRLDKATGTCTLIHKGESDNIFIIGSSDEGVWMHDNHDIWLLRTGASGLEAKGHLEGHMIRSGHICEKGIIWLATGNGLYRFDPTDGIFRHIRTSLFTEATAAVCDHHSRIWVGTEHNLFAYLIESDSFAMFGESDGAAPNEYLSKPRLFSREGDVYMGGVQGLLCINEDFAIETSEIPLLKLCGLIADGNDMTEGKKGIYEIPRHSKSLTVNVNIQEKDMFRHKLYRFAFADGGPVYETSSPSLDIRQMPEPGRYDIMVSCTRRDGSWTTPVKAATIRIPQPWYLSAWFLGSIGALILGIVITILLYISYRKSNELRLALKEQEQQVYEEKVKMLINISHELRTPLTLIMAPLKRIIKDLSPEDEHYPTLGRVYRQSRRMRDLLNMVLDLRKMEVGKNNLHIERVHYNRWLEESIADLAAEEISENIEIVTDLDPNIRTVCLDTRKCDTVLMNIMINAVKHSSAGDTITIKTRMTEDGMVRTCVSDRGPGLGDTDPDKIFTRFYQSNNEQYGSGIGLSYSKILVEMHNGRIGAENNPDKGATFWWEIPLTNEITEVQQPKAYLNEVIGHNPTDEMKIPEGAFFSTSDKKLMIVDDSQDLLDFLREAMAGDFAEIMTAGGGNQVLEILSHGHLPDIIVSDINMPEGDGYTLCSKLKSDERYIHIPVILLTARGEEQSQGDVYKVGADAYMSKPFETETLLELIRNLLRRKENIRKRYFDNNGETAIGYGSTEEGFILRLNAIIAEHIDNPDLDQQLLCRELGVSRALLYNRMKAITGTGTKDYITRIRLEKAKNLIETTELPIMEISEMTGFTSQSYFSTAFKTYTGMTPSRYKKEQRSRQQ